LGVNDRSLEPEVDLPLKRKIFSFTKSEKREFLSNSHFALKAEIRGKNAAGLYRAHLKAGIVIDKRFEQAKTDQVVVRLDYVGACCRGSAGSGDACRSDDICRGSSC
jgi:hypothetical protein